MSISGQKPEYSRGGTIYIYIHTVFSPVGFKGSRFRLAFLFSVSYHRLESLVVQIPWSTGVPAGSVLIVSSLRRSPGPALIVLGPGSPTKKEQHEEKKNTPG